MLIWNNNKEACKCVGTQFNLKRFDCVLDEPKLFACKSGQICNVLEPKQFKNNLIMLEDKPQFEFAAS